VIDTARVRLGFFESFLGADTLLMDGDAEGMALLAKTLRDFPGSDQSSLALHELEFVDTRAGIRLVASRAARDSGIERDGDCGRALNQAEISSFARRTRRSSDEEACVVGAARGRVRLLDVLVR
jgi:hypothetical protein